MNKKLSFYERISKFSGIKSYTGKIFLIAFLGTHVPLIAISIYLVLLSPSEGRLSVLLITLLATLIGTGFTLISIYKLLAPVLLVSEALNKYNSERIVPNLPNNFTDEAGLLMRSTQQCISELDNLLMFKGRILAIASHDSKTPLGSIKIASNVIKNEIKKDNPNIEDVLSHIEIIETSNRNHSEFLNNMLSIAKFDSGEIQIQKEKVLPEELFKNLTINHQFYFTSKEIKFSMNSNFSDEEKLNIDKDKMMSVLNNLVQNAIKFTEHGGVIELNFEKIGDKHLIHVKDSGIGIPDEKRQLIFNAFSQSSKGTKSESGSGLGLWIVKLFTNLHGGDVSFESEKGKGTVFTISLPLV